MHSHTDDTRRFTASAGGDNASQVSVANCVRERTSAPEFFTVLLLILMTILMTGINLFVSLSEKPIIYVDPQSTYVLAVRNSNTGGLDPSAAQQQQFPRTIYFDGDSFAPMIPHRILADDVMLHADPREEAVNEGHHSMVPNHEDPDCIPMAEWQTQSFPNCNVVHEMDLRRAANEEDIASIHELGKGFFRSTWKWAAVGDKSIALRTLRMDRQFHEFHFDLHRRDAVAMERLTHSPFVMNIYGYCGQSALSELADFMFKGNYQKIMRRGRTALRN
jgi:hypothetical protein